MSSAAFAQLPANPPLVSTTGTAEIRVVPDLADLNFDVEVRNSDLDAARKLQAERMAKILSALRASGVAETELSTSQVLISPYYEGDRREEVERIKYYSVSQSITATLHGVKHITDVTAVAVTAGVTRVQNAVLRTSQLRRYRDEARTKAIIAAKEKAMALAVALGAKAARPYTISESGNYGMSLLSNGNSIGNVDAAADNTTMATFAPGSISISASVFVSFSLE